MVNKRDFLKIINLYSGQSFWRTMLLGLLETQESDFAQVKSGWKLVRTTYCQIRDNFSFIKASIFEWCIELNYIFTYKDIKDLNILNL
jgi:hypothetical protein